MAEPENGSSPLAEALARVGDRWTLLVVVEALPGGPQRLHDLLGQIPELVSETAARRRGGGAISSSSSALDPDTCPPFSIVRISPRFPAHAVT
jgi:hypothetical protein